MATTISALSWSPYQAGQSGTLIASVTLDSATDTEFIVPIVGQYSNNQVYAGGVIVINQSNASAVLINAGPLVLSIDPYSRDYLKLDANIGGAIKVTIQTGATVFLVFYRGEPPINPSLSNYAGAQALSNNVVFPGAVTGGAPLAQTLTVPSNYAFTNGVLISATSGFSPIGATTIAINGGPPIEIKKVFSAGGPTSLEGGEMIAGANILLSANTVANCWELINPANMSDLMTEAFLFAQVLVITAGVYVQGPFIILTPGKWRITGKMQLLTGANLQCTLRLQDITNGTTLDSMTVGMLSAFARAEGFLQGIATLGGAGSIYALQLTANVGGGNAAMDPADLMGTSFVTWIRGERIS